MRRTHTNANDPIVRAIFANPALGRDENAALSRIVSGGGEAATIALKQMVTGNMRLVLSIARKYPDGSMTLHDRVQEGAMGLMRAARRFDPDRGFSFATYASYWVRATIERAIQENEHTLSVPNNVVMAIRRLKRIEATSRNPLTAEEVEYILQLGTRTEATLRVMRSTTVPLDSPINGLNGSDMVLSEVIADDFAENPEELVLDKDVFVALSKCPNLTNRDYVILSQYMSGGTYASIGDKLGLSRERVRQILVKVMAAIRKVLER